MRKYYFFVLIFALVSLASAQSNLNNSPFKQLHELLPTPNTYRTASGAPGHEYWQQKVDYSIKVTLDDEKQRVEGAEKITYHNNSPDELEYLWLQLDQNNLKPNAEQKLTRSTKKKYFQKKMPFKTLNILQGESFDGGYKITAVTDGDNVALPYIINNTMMRVDLPKPLKPGERFEFNIEWNFSINDHKKFRERCGYEYFEKDENYIYEIAQWFPRLCVYADYQGWQNKQFLGRGEFALEFGDYEVEITAPANHVVGSTGELQNPEEVLGKEWIDRLKDAENTDDPIFIITPKEAKKNEKSETKQSKTWIFKAQNVRDFAWVSSKKFIWDAMAVQVGNKKVMAMSYYPNEAEPMWSLFSTRAIAHTLKVYSRYTFNYPYPVAISVNGPVYGMEYPMICFNGPRPEKDGTYSANTKRRLISVIIHEVGHNFFPMIVSSDERQWTWMDEGLNSFCQFLAEQEWEENYPSRRGYPKDIVRYMSSSKEAIVPIMTNSESILQFGNNAYGKPAIALNILRETIMGRELFDFAFKKYAERWAFKHPEPADLFRSLEDASAVDLDWFWRGWFYTTDNVDIAISDVNKFTIDSKNPEKEKKEKREKKKSKPLNVTKQNNKDEGMKYLVEKHEKLADFYTKYNPYTVTEYDKSQYKDYLDKLNDKEKSMVGADKIYYLVDFENIGGLVMPLILQINYTDGTNEIRRFPAEAWVRNAKKITKVIVTQKEVQSFSLDPFSETADINLNNNTYPPAIASSKFELYKKKKKKKENLMQKKKEDKL